MHKFEDMVKYLRELHKTMTLRNMEKKIGINHSFIARIIRGEIYDPSLSTLERLDKAMKEDNYEN